MNNQQIKNKEPRFVFNRVEVAIHLAFLAFIVYSGLSLLVSVCSESQGTTLESSYMGDIINKKRDAHDLQWETFRKNLSVLVACIFVWNLISPRIEKIRNDKAWVFGLVMLAYSYRSDLLLFAFITTSWYYFTIKCWKWKYFIHSCWVIMICTLFVCEYTHHFAQLSHFIGRFIPFYNFNSYSRQLSCGQNLNMTFLKLISFSSDLKRGNEGEELKKHLEKCRECTKEQYCLKGRNFVEPDNYGWLNYWNYILFTPTFLAGPPISFKNFISFKKMPSKKHPEYLYFILLFISFEIFQHYLPVVPLTLEYTLIQSELITLFHLVFIWYKFLIIWRFHKLWAQIHGIEVIDNLSRCIFNNYGFEGFWRMWHRGFNQWLVRYLYIPLGGNKKIGSVIATVAFVSFWHDHSLNIVIWGLVIVIFILPEILIKRYVKRKYSYLFQYHWFKYICALSAAIYIYILILTNIIGFGYGLNKLSFLWQKIKGEWIQLIWSILVVASVVILMFYKRQIEERKKNY